MAELEDVHVSLLLSSTEGDPQEITERLGVQPTHSHRAGQQREGRLQGLQYNNSVWTLESRLGREVGLERNIRDIYEQLSSNSGIIAAILKKGWMGEIRCAMFLNGQNQGTTLTAEAIRLLATLGTDVGLDIYAECEDDQASLF